MSQIIEKTDHFFLEINGNETETIVTFNIEAGYRKNFDSHTYWGSPLQEDTTEIDLELESILSIINAETKEEILITNKIEKQLRPKLIDWISENYLEIEREVDLD